MRNIRFTPGVPAKFDKKVSVDTPKRSHRAVTDTVAAPPTGMFWFTVRMFAPACANAVSNAESTPGRSFNRKCTVSNSPCVADTS